MSLSQKKEQLGYDGAIPIGVRCPTLTSKVDYAIKHPLKLSNKVKDKGLVAIKQSSPIGCLL
jgi:hypothetical protein